MMEYYVAVKKNEVNLCVQAGEMSKAKVFSRG